MRAFRRYTVTVTEPACDILGLPESTTEFVATTDFASLLAIWSAEW